VIARYDSVIVVFVTRVLVPLIQLFALYVVVHGPFSPGGGFQGGAILAASVILMRLALGGPASQRRFGHGLMRWLAALGVLIYRVVGLIPLALGHHYLDYGGLPLPGVEGPARRAWGIFLVEVGVALAVLGTLVTIFDHLVGGRR